VKFEQFANFKIKSGQILLSFAHLEAKILSASGAGFALCSIYLWTLLEAKPPSPHYRLGLRACHEPPQLP